MGLASPSATESAIFLDALSSPETKQHPQARSNPEEEELSSSATSLEAENRSASEAWKRHLTSQLIESGYVAEACVLDRKDLQVYASTSFEFRPYRMYYHATSCSSASGNNASASNSPMVNEIQTLMTLVKQTASSSSSSTMHTMYFNKEKYQILRIQEESQNDGMKVVYARSLTTHRPLCIAITQKLVILGRGTDQSPGSLNAIVCAMAEYMHKHGM